MAMVGVDSGSLQVDSQPFYIHQMNPVNYRNGSAMMIAP